MNPLHKKLLEQLEHYPLDQSARGVVRFFAFDKKTGLIRKVIDKRNLILFEGADILAQSLIGNADYRVRTMYMEFKNLPSPSTPITPPVFDRSGGIAYYDGLSSSLDTDFLRVPLTFNPTISSSGSEYAGNQATFFGLSEGTAGFNGKLFDPSVNSAVFGAALVASPDVDTQDTDKVFSRVYSGIDKVLKEAGFEIGVTWTIRFN